jgi:putative transposase
MWRILSFHKSSSSNTEIGKMSAAAFDPKKHHRRSIRLKGYDYSGEGLYFVTICTHERECVLGEIKDGRVVLSGFGEIAKRCWEEIPGHFEGVGLDEYVIMPNHVHGVILLQENPCRDEVTSSLRVTSSPQVPSFHTWSSETEPQRLDTIKHPTLGQIVAFYKYRSTKLINVIRDVPGTRFWQRNYYEHIIRDGNDLDRVRKYILENVAKWSEDKKNPENDSIEIN